MSKQIRTRTKTKVLTDAVRSSAVDEHIYRSRRRFLLIVLLILAHLPFGIIASALVISFRTDVSVPRAIIFFSALLGGVYYPTRVIPAWIQDVSAVLPLTYGLRALRRVVLEGATLSMVALDVIVLTLFAAGLLAVSALAFSLGMRYARRAGSLAQY